MINEIGSALFLQRGARREVAQAARPSGPTPPAAAAGKSSVRDCKLSDRS